ncbi:Transcription factor [Pleurostoma richardsiae]|uniref:Transcription factor n=1 Tax=Pleurostoma richardsiae TaxID=41990 RepID=A0AA38REM9_9PEZI|nr:Transcription factor [Pleurostoma richardsiae]
MHRLRNDDADEDPRPRKQRKPRPSYSCAECRRLKMKCDRQEPCSNCVRRHRVKFCIAAATSAEVSRRDSIKTFRLSILPWTNNLCTKAVMGTEDMSIGIRDAKMNRHLPLKVPGKSSQRNSPRIAPIISLHKAAPATITSSTLSPFLPTHSSHTPSRASLHILLLPHPQQSANNGQQSGSYGTLMLGKRGRSKYLGPTAGSEWLKESEMQDVSDTPLMTRAPSPELHQDSVPSRSSLLTSHTTPIAFPLNASPARISTRDLLSCLPPREEAWTLVESYYRYCAWHHDVAPKTSFERTFDRVYTRAESGSSSSPLNPQEIALVFIIMAQGTMFNIEMPDSDSSAEDWLRLSERALVKGDFLSNNTVAGLQTLHLMAHLHLQLDKDRRGDSAWPLWGLVMRLIQAMGMHRDGDRWNLPRDVAEERRKVFWECNAADIFQAHCFSRPCAINPEHCDTAFPSEPLKPNGEKNYSILRFELSQLSSEILNMAMKVRKPAYSDVIGLDVRLCEFECNIPFSLRCRAALLATPSRYPQLEAAIEASPEPSRRSLTISFQQTNLALNVSETIINLHRPYYAKALYEADHVESVYKPSFYTVIERCAIIIGIITDIHTRFPAVSTRQWNFWYHVFNSALCLGTLVLRDPGNVMASFVLAQIDAAISLFTSLLQHGARTPRYKRNLQWLLNLRTRALSKISEASTADKGGPQRDAASDRQSNSGDGDGQKEHEEDVELLGWRTRLIERAGQGRRKTIKTIRLPETPTDSLFTDTASLPLNEDHFPDLMGTPGMAMPGASLPAGTLDSTDDILHGFWDPILLQDVFGLTQDQSNPYTINRTTWWDDSSDATQARV